MMYLRVVEKDEDYGLEEVTARWKRPKALVMLFDEQYTTFVMHGSLEMI